MVDQKDHFHMKLNPPTGVVVVPSDPPRTPNLAPMPGDDDTFVSADSVDVTQAALYPTDILNTLSPNGILASIIYCVWEIEYSFPTYHSLLQLILIGSRSSSQSARV